jgi:DNA-binding CsgD family transcriptional regulator
MPRKNAPAVSSLLFLEAAYAWELDEKRWLQGVLDAAVGVWGRPHWAYVCTYDVSDASRCSMSTPVFWGAPPPLRKLFAERITERVSHPDVIQLNRTVSLGFAKPVGGVDQTDREALKQSGTPDMFVLNGLDGTGRGCQIGFGAERTSLLPEEILLLQRLVAHLSSAYRCRRRIHAERTDPVATSEAVLRPDGRVLDARGPATETRAREALTAAARSIERSRRSHGRESPTTHWHPRIKTRWTLVDGPAEERERCMLARENQLQPQGFDGLTERERQVVVSVATGRSLKEVGYELGISYATARVLLARAYGRLGVTSRDDLLALPSIRALRGEVAS